jgi:hypothetical protein
MKSIVVPLAACLAIALSGCDDSAERLASCEDAADASKTRAVVALHHKISESPAGFSKASLSSENLSGPARDEFRRRAIAKLVEAEELRIEAEYRARLGRCAEPAPDRA